MHKPNLWKGEGCWGWMGETSTRNENCAKVNIFGWWKLQYCCSTSTATMQTNPAHLHCIHILYSNRYSCMTIQVTRSYWNELEFQETHITNITIKHAGYGYYLFYDNEIFFLSCLCFVLDGNLNHNFSAAQLSNSREKEILLHI